MIKLYSLLVFSLMFSACVHRYQRLPLSVVTVNGKYKNHLIADRIPDYGDGHADGCVVEPQMRVDIKTINQSSISGVISDVKTKAPLAGASITCLAKIGQTFKVQANTQGIFRVDSATRLNRIEITYVGYRSLVVNFENYQH